MRILTVLGSLIVMSLPLLGISALVHPVDGHAADATRSDEDCAQLLERWATDPKAAPKRVIDTCKQQLAAIAPAAGPADESAERADPARVARLDPCSGPDAGDSVLCWGPWASLAPAAAAPLVTLNLPEVTIECDLLADQCVPTLALVDPILPVDGCTPGTPCGFATVVDGFADNSDAEDTTFARFNMAPDGSQFTVSPAGAPPINSVTGMDTNVRPRPDGYENMRATGAVDNQESALTARVVRDDDDEVVLAADVWTHVSSVQPDLVAQSGYFAWGTTTSQAGLDALNAGNVSLHFSGPMSVNKATTANMTLNMGTRPNWTSTWDNPDWSFGAGGPISGVNLISEPDQFTSNVIGTDDFVQGALVGEPGGPHGIAHIIDVTLEGQGRIKDVGLLRDMATPMVEP